MFKMIRMLGLREVVAEEAFPLAFSLALAEVFYKFHSFLLEALAFLATWYLIGGFLELGSAWVGRHRR